MFNKYKITKTSGAPIDEGAQYFVLRVDTDRAARVAVSAYADEIELTEPSFAEVLRDWMIQFETAVDEEE